MLISVREFHDKILKGEIKTGAIVGEFIGKKLSLVAIIFKINKDDYIDLFFFNLNKVRRCQMPDLFRF